VAAPGEQVATIRPGKDYPDLFCRGRWVSRNQFIQENQTISPTAAKEKFTRGGL
jgi:hypothetical protein